MIDTDTDPRAALAAIMDRFKAAHADVITHKIPAYQFIGEFCITLLAEMEDLMGLLCAQHGVGIEVKV